MFFCSLHFPHWAPFFGGNTEFCGFSQYTAHEALKENPKSTACLGGPFGPPQEIGAHNTDQRISDKKGFPPRLACPFAAVCLAPVTPPWGWPVCSCNLGFALCLKKIEQRKHISNNYCFNQDYKFHASRRAKWGWILRVFPSRLSSFVPICLRSGL